MWLELNQLIEIDPKCQEDHRITLIIDMYLQQIQHGTIYRYVPRSVGLNKYLYGVFVLN